MEFAASGRLQPGFRFHPTNVELVMYYLKRKVLCKVLKPEMITEVNVYQFHPKDLRDLACLKKDLNWYFFCPRGKKYGCGVRTNRATHCGYWKATGNDRDVSYEDRIVGKIKTLVFHEGKPPKGKRTDWVMHEYRLEDKKMADAGLCQDSYVLCKIFEKSGLGPKNAEQYGAPFIEEEWEDEEEIVDCAQVMHIGDPNQTTSAVTSVLISDYAYPASTSDHAYSGAVSVSAVDQAPLVPYAAAANVASSSKSPMPYYDSALVPYAAAANIASSSNGPFPNYDYPAMDQMLPQTPVAGNSVSSSKAPLPNYDYPAVWETQTPNDAAIASTSAAPVLINDDDEIDRMLEMFVVGNDNRGIFETLEDLDQTDAHRPESSCWQNFDEDSILYLSDLDEPLRGG